MKHLRQHARGVTLLELLVVVAIISILAVISLPNIPGIIAQNRLRAAANDLMSKLRTVRSTAISKGRPIEVEFTIRNPSSPADRDKAYYFTATRQAYIEYNLLAKVDDLDFNRNVLAGKLVDAGGKSIDEYLAEDHELPDEFKPMILFTESREPLHLMSRWNADGTPDYRVPINSMQETGRDNGIYCMRLNTTIGAGCGPTASDANLKIVFSSTGMIEPPRVIVIEGHPRYTQGLDYELVLYKGGQIRIRSKR